MIIIFNIASVEEANLQSIGLPLMALAGAFR